MTDITGINKTAHEARKVVYKQPRAENTLTEVAHRFQRDSINKNLTMHHLLENIERNKSLMNAFVGPLAELRKAGIFDRPSPLQQEIQRIGQIMAEFEARFTLPEEGATAQLVRQYQLSSLSETMAQYSETITTVQKAMGAMRTPWLDMQQVARSLTSFARLQGIGSIVTRLPTFEDQALSVLRVDLGDWRDPITWPDSILTDLAARTDFYVERGFDQALTDFPASAFQESLQISGLRTEPPPMSAVYGAPFPPPGDDEEEKALARTNEAHNWLLRLEFQLRKFIDDEMTRVFGPNWPKRRLPGELYDKWQDKKSQGEQAGEQAWPLIAYADFTDYQKIICKRDNWREVFAPHFRRQESVRETFQRLYPVRLSTMHARPITQEDELLLYVETRRLVKVITR